MIKNFNSVTSHALDTPLSQTVGPSQTPHPPLEREVLYGWPRNGSDRASELMNYKAHSPDCSSTTPTVSRVCVNVQTIVCTPIPNVQNV